MAVDTLKWTAVLGGNRFTLDWSLPATFSGHFWLPPFYLSPQPHFPHVSQSQVHGESVRGFCLFGCTAGVGRVFRKPMVAKL